MNTREIFFDLDNRLSDIIIDIEKAAAIQEEIQEGYFPYIGITEDNQYELTSAYPRYGVFTNILGDYIRRINNRVEVLRKALEEVRKGVSENEPDNANI